MFYTSSLMMPVLLLTLITFISSIVLIAILRKRRRLVIIPLAVFVGMTFHLVYLMYLSYSSIRETRDIVCQEYVESLTPEDVIDVGEEYVLIGELYFRELEEKHGDDMIEMASHINISTNVTENSSMWNILYMNDTVISQYFDFKYDSLMLRCQKVELVAKAKRIGDNEWECLKVIDVQVKEGLTYIGD